MGAQGPAESREGQWAWEFMSMGREERCSDNMGVSACRGQRVCECRSLQNTAWQWACECSRLQMSEEGIVCDREQMPTDARGQLTGVCRGCEGQWVCEMCACSDQQGGNDILRHFTDG